MNELFGNVDDFYAMFAAYNQAVWPMPIVMYVLALAAFIFSLQKRQGNNAVVLYILSFFWLWNAVVFSLLYFSRFSSMFYMSALLFIFQAIVLFLNGSSLAVKPRLSFKLQNNFKTWAGMIFIMYALILYPIIGWAASHAYPAGPIFGTAPCPSAIFTVGMLLLAEKKISKILLIIPVIWGFAGFLPVLIYDVYADIGLILSGVASLILILSPGDSGN